MRLLAANPRIHDLAMTTNGVLLAEQAPALSAAGLHRVTVSLDTLRDGPLQALTRRDTTPACWRASRRWGGGLARLKLDTVVMRGVNDDELADLIEFGTRVSAEVRFIEYMDVGGATRWCMERVVSRGRC